MSDKQEKLEIPKGALRMTQVGCSAHVEFADDGGVKKPKLDMLAYSGKIIKGHWYWGDLAIDLEGMQFNKKKYPILEAHDTSRKIAFSNGPPLRDNNELRFNPDKISFVDTSYSQEFQKLSSEGFPYESSIYVTPTNIEWLEEGASASVNGFTMKGPGAIFRKCVFNEASICVFGYDRQTQSAVFSKEDKTELFVFSSVVENMIKTNEDEKEVKIGMDLAQLKKDHPDLVVQIQNEIKSEFDKKIADEKTAFSVEMTSIKTEIAKKDERILELEKRDAIRAEKELNAFADKIWSAKLAASNISERLHVKVKGHVSYSKFVKDEKLDEVAFGKAIEDEIASWEQLGATNDIMGTSFSIKEDVGSATKLAQKKETENKEALGKLLSLAGQNRAA